MSAPGGFWDGRRVLVTGATGLLGSWLAPALVERGAEVVALVRDWVPRSRFYLSGSDRAVAQVRGCLEDLPLLARALNEYEVEAVFHLGAQTIVGTANRSPLSTFETNVRGTWNLLEACRTSPTVRRVVVASSDKAYGAHERLPYTEDAPLLGAHPYDVSKACADLIARAYHRTWGLPVAITRCGNFYGGGDLNFNRLVPGTARSALRGERPLIRSDGTYVRDYIYVEDAVAAYLGLAEALDRPEVQGEAFNFSTGEPLAALDLARRVLAAAGREDLEPVVLDEATGEIHSQHLDSARARRVLGWQARHGLAAGLARTVAWYRDYLAGAPGGPQR
ncbi:MAG: GDP-mannose 4,6-dehydratase [Planctomycetes bacterium]|nr:GDP-mannose 4,6-dehydratase [Planctomycetota bacterium]